jgi:hypothetical protein
MGMRKFCRGTPLSAPKFASPPQNWRLALKAMGAERLEAIGARGDEAERLEAIGSGGG